MAPGGMLADVWKLPAMTKRVYKLAMTMSKLDGMPIKEIKAVLRKMKRLLPKP